MQAQLAAQRSPQQVAREARQRAQGSSSFADIIGGVGPEAPPTSTTQLPHPCAAPPRAAPPRLTNAPRPPPCPAFFALPCPPRQAGRQAGRRAGMHVHDARCPTAGYLDI
jgi:hypothetical protein